MSKPSQKHLLSYEQLEELTHQLQDRVTQGIMTQQQLITIRDELDQELNRYRLLQEFSQFSLSLDHLQTFADTTVEFFVQAFEQPHCLFAIFDETQQHFTTTSTFGFTGQQIPDFFIIKGKHEQLKNIKLLSQSSELQSSIDFLNLQEALIAFLVNPNQIINGLIICGQKNEDQRFYPSITNKLTPSFAVMGIQTAYLLHNFNATERLRQEIRVRKRVEKMLENKAADLMRSNADLEQFAYVVSHDLKAPLHNVKGYSKILKEKYNTDLSDKAKSYLSIILDEINRFGDTIDALLKYARFNSSKAPLQHIDFQELVEKIQRQIQLTLDQRSVIIQCSDLPTVHASGLQMEQLVLNLITNAIKFTPPEIAPVIHISATLKNEAFLFCVKDNGIGLPPGQEETIFNLFNRLHKDVYEGSGIGLSICKKIVQQHGGKIWAVSPGQNKGTSFYFTLPTHSSKE